nr:hypothetical protein VITISV_019983 [Ipomoea trifida]GMC70233.1 CLAVATA3/ESR (CLE)-related protein 6-like [Ipomoea batatas]
MASFMKSICLVVVMLWMVLASVEARVSDKFMSGLRLHEFGLDEQKMEYYRRRAMLNDAGIMREAPDGPDPEHH